MEWGKVKSILIVLLLVVNLLLGVNIFLQIAERGEAELSALQAAMSLLRQDGAVFEERLFLDMPLLPLVQTGVRSAEREAAVAEALLGASTLNEAGGGVSIYTSARGSVTFRSGGLFEAELADGTAPAQMLDSIVQSAAVSGLTWSIEPSGLRAQLCLSGRPVIGAAFECAATGAGARASGRWYFGGEPQREGTAAARAEMAVALLRLERGEPLEIAGLQPVYAIEQQRGGLRFVPSWRVELKTGTVLLSGATKEEIPLE